MKSRLERRFRDLLIRHGIELPERNASVGPWTVDCLWREQRVAVELDGRQHERPTRPTATTTATSGCAATATWPAATASARSSERPDDVIADLLDAFAEAGRVRPTDARRSTRS